jgi:hypothetical protein
MAPRHVAPSAWHLQSVSLKQEPVDCGGGTHSIAPPLLEVYVQTSVPHAVPASVQSTSTVQDDCARATLGKLGTKSAKESARNGRNGKGVKDEALRAKRFIPRMKRRFSPAHKGAPCRPFG